MRISHLNSAGRATAVLARRVGARLTPELLLRSSLGVVYFWFGTLKLIGLSPVVALVRQAYPAMATVPLYCSLAVFELAIGLALLIGVWQRWVAAGVILHLVGTFGVLFSSPRTAFLPQFPFLTLEGEFVVKNIVLLAAAFTLFLNAPGKEPSWGAGRHVRAWTVAVFLSFSTLLGFAAARLHQSIRTAARDSIADRHLPIEMTAATVNAFTGTAVKQPIEVSGVMVDRCQILGCWLRLRDSSGELFVDLAPGQLNAREIPIGTKIRIVGSIGKTREGQIGFVAAKMQAASNAR